MLVRCAFATRQARDNLGTLGQEELQQFQDIIDMENPDLYKWLTGQTPVPEEVCAAAASLDLCFGRSAKVFYSCHFALSLARRWATRCSCAYVWT